MSLPSSNTTTRPPPKKPAVAKQKPFQKPRSTATASSPFKPPTSSNPPAKATSNDLPSRITQLKTTIQHTHSQLTETIEKYEAVKAGRRQPQQQQQQQQQQDATSDPIPAKNQTDTINPTISTQPSDLPSETTTATPGPPFPPVLTSSQTSQLKDAQATLTHHIELLKKYNALKDAGMMMMEILAEREGRRVGEVMGERGVGED